MSELPKTMLATILLAIMSHAVSFAGEPQEIELSFSHSGNQFEAKASFKCHAQSMASLENLIYNPKDVEQYLKDSCKVKVIQDNGDAHVLLYRGSFLFWSADTQVERKLDREKHVISFNMTKFESTGSLPAPKILSSSGYWKLSSLQDAFLVEFHQTCAVESMPVPFIYCKEARIESLRCLTAIKNHIDASSLLIVAKGSL